MAKKIKVPRPNIGSVSAWIVTDGRTDCECQVLDISPAGAKVVVQASAGVPNSFELAFFQSVAQRRRCEVVWRTGKVLGVRFVI